MDDLNQLLRKINNEILIVCEKEKMNSLDPNGSLKIDGKNTLQFYLDITRKDRVKKVPFQDIDYYDDLYKKTIDIKFLIANMYLHKPHLWDFEKNAIKIDEKKIYRYFPSFHDLRYLMYCDILFQVIYNFWDKIGDLLALFFDTKLKEKEIYFGNVLKNIPVAFKESENYVWLNDFYFSDFNGLNERRKKIVHYNNISTDVSGTWKQNMENEEVITSIQKEIDALPDYFREHLRLCIIGYERALKLIDEIC